MEITPSKEISNVPSVAVQPRGSLPSEHEMQVVMAISKHAAASKMYNNIGNEAGILVTVLAARELGIPPMMALNGGIRNLNGNIEISARMMNAMLRKAGIILTIKENSESRCVIHGRRPDGSEYEASYEFAEAQRAGLVKPAGGWTKNPKDMCFARCISRLARVLGPDIIGGLYVEGEISEAEVTVIDKPYEPLEQEDPASRLVRLLNNFPSEEREKLSEYLGFIASHFKWDMKTTLDNVDKDFVKFKENFETWKKKNQQSGAK